MDTKNTIRINVQNLFILIHISKKQEFNSITNTCMSGNSKTQIPYLPSAIGGKKQIFNIAFQRMWKTLHSYHSKGTSLTVVHSIAIYSQNPAGDKQIKLNETHHKETLSAQ